MDDTALNHLVLVQIDALDHIQFNPSSTPRAERRLPLSYEWNLATVNRAEHQGVEAADHLSVEFRWLRSG